MSIDLIASGGGRLQAGAGLAHEFDADNEFASRGRPPGLRGDSGVFDRPPVDGSEAVNR